MVTTPERREADPYYFRYIDKVPAGDIVEFLSRQLDQVLPIFETVSEERSLFRYAPGKWSFRQVLNHVNDTERVFAFRSLWFARGFASELPSFEQDLAVSNAAPDDCPWQRHVEELKLVRMATHEFFRNLPLHGWDRSGTASGKLFTVRAMAFIIAGHLEHHLAVLRERYQISLSP